MHTVRKWLCLLVLLLPCWAQAAPDTPYDVSLMLYYPRLTESQQAIFDLAYPAAWQGESRVELPGGTSYDDACAAMDALALDCPELCALSGAYSVGYYRDNPDEAIYIDLNYIMPAARQQELLDMAADLAARATGDDFAREVYLHDLLCAAVSYDGAGENAHNAYGALAEGRAVCDGYARAMVLLLRLSGMESGMVTGVMRSTGASHAWNLVKVDGAYTWLDVTNDDQRAMTTYFCFNLTDEWLLRSHAPEGENLPACTDPSVNWHVRNRRYVSAGDDLQKRVLDSFSAMTGQGSRFCLRFEQEEDYRSLRDNLFFWAIQYNKLFQRPLEGQLLTYHDDAQRCVIVLFDE